MILLFDIELVFNWWNTSTFLLCVAIPLWIWLYHKENERLVAYIPSACTSIGIFFTFLILFITLGVKLDTTALTGPESLRSTIQQLAAKFSCSLIGIFGSIIWSIIIKYNLGNKEQMRRKTLEWMQKEPQELLWELTRSQAETATAIRTHTVQSDGKSDQLLLSLQSIGRELKTGFKDNEDLQQRSHEALIQKVTSIEEIVAKNLKDSFTKFSELLSKHIEQMGSEALNQSKVKVAEIQREFSDQSQELLSKYEATLKGTLQDIKASADSLAPVMEKLANNFDKQTSTIQDSAAKNTKEIQANFTTITQNIASQFATIQETFSNFDEKVQESSKQVLNNHLQTIKDTFDSLEVMQERTKTILEESTSQFTKAVDEYKTVHFSHTELLNRMGQQNEILDNLQQDARSGLKHWSTQLGQIEHMNHRIADIGNVVNQLQGLKDKLHGVLPTNTHQ